MTRSSPLLLRADAGPQIGSGHVMRCLALAQAWRHVGGEAVFVCAASLPGVASRLGGEALEQVTLAVEPGSAADAAATAALARQRGAAWVILDGYQFGGDYQRAIKHSGLRLLVVDDHAHAEHYWADVVLNQNLQAQEGMYERREPDTELLLGTRYALLRREFLAWQPRQREIPEVARKVLVTLGGADQQPVLRKVLRALREVPIDGLEVSVVGTVDAATCQGQYERGINGGSSAAIRLEGLVADMPAKMAWADMALGAGGATCWERAFMGLPSLVLVLADNQRPTAECLAASQAAVNLGNPEALTPDRLTRELTELMLSRDRRKAMSHVSRQLVDGRGAERVCGRLTGAGEPAD